jgi:serine/threonine protein kinase
MGDALLHPNAERLAAYQARLLSSEDAARVAAHLRSCPSCVQLLQASEAVTLTSEQQPSTATEMTAPPVAPLAPDASSLSQVPASLANHPRYRVLQLLGSGGMGSVYKAEHRIMERLVALKIVNPRFLGNPDGIRRFHQEVKAAARLNHPHIVTAHDAEQAGDLHFLVMEYVDGISLDQVVAKRGPLPLAHACEYIRQAALGLQHAFENGMVHRDIKPHNLILAPKGRIKILDFGLARFVSESGGGPKLTAADVVMGTPDYIAPEQAIDAHKADIRADIYSLGCTFYQLLSGQLPFPEETVVQKILGHMERSPPPVRDFRDDVTPELACVLGKMMAKDPAERYQTPMEVARALGPFAKQTTPVTKNIETPAASDAPTLVPRRSKATIEAIPLAGEKRVERAARLPERVASTRPRRRGRKHDKSGRRRNWGNIARLTILLLVLAMLLGFAAYRVTINRGITDEGELIIVAAGVDAELVVTQGGRQVTIIDTRTTNKVWLKSGEYEVALKPDAKGVFLPTTRYTVSRGDKQFVVVEKLGAPTPHPDLVPKAGR